MMPSSPPREMPTSVQHMRVANKQTAMRELQRSHKLHLSKLDGMKASIDMAAPECTKYKHVHINAKRMQIEAERNAAIERENKILLGKMYTIMNSEPAYKTTPLPQVTSLNMTVRKQEYDRIARENQAIMQRILQRDSNFSRASLDAEWKVTQGYLNRISEFPFILGHLPPATRKQTLKPLDGEGEEEGEAAEEGAAGEAAEGAADEGAAAEGEAPPPDEPADA